MLDEKFWDKYMKIYDLVRILIPYQELLDELAAELNVQEGEKILDAGCGTGNLIERIKKFGVLIYGIDNANEVLKICKARNPEAEIIFADLNKPLLFPDGFFDKIVSNNTLYALPAEKQQLALNEFSRILRPAGKVVISNPREKSKTLKIFTSHLKKSFAAKGVIATITELLKVNLFSLFRLSCYNQKIEREGHFFNEIEWRNMFDRAKFTEIAIRPVYVGQAILITAKKPSEPVQSTVQGSPVPK